MKNLVKVLDEKFYIFLNATEKEIERTMPKNWSESMFYVNCDNYLLTVEEAEKSWTK